MTESLNRGAGIALVVVVAAAMVGCASSSRTPAPVEDRGAGVSRPAPVATETAPAAGKVLPGAENAGKPGYYTVKPGDTLVRIGLEHGQNWRDLVRWNALENPNIIEVGQVLRVVSTDAGSVRDFQAFARQTGNELVEQETAGEDFIHFMRRR